MNNFELDRRAKELAASNSGYNLARRFLMLEDQLAEARRELGGWAKDGWGEWYTDEVSGWTHVRTDVLKRHIESVPPAPAAVPDVPTDDMINEGVLTLIRGLKRFGGNYYQVVNNVWEDMYHAYNSDGEA